MTISKNKIAKHSSEYRSHYLKSRLFDLIRRNITKRARLMKKEYLDIDYKTASLLRNIKSSTLTNLLIKLSVNY